MTIIYKKIVNFVPDDTKWEIVWDTCTRTLHVHEHNRYITTRWRRSKSRRDSLFFFFFSPLLFLVSQTSYRKALISTNVHQANIGRVRKTLQGRWHYRYIHEIRTTIMSYRVCFEACVYTHLYIHIHMFTFKLEARQY